MLAHGLYALGHAVNCDESCARVHAGHGCEHESHACGCPHSESYDFDWEPSGEVAERWSERAGASLLQFLPRFDCSTLTLEEIESRLEWWWRGENHALRRAMESNHRTRCARGRGWLVNRVTGQRAQARCKSWRECSYCAWAYGVAVERLFKQVNRLRAFVVFTMPPESGDWSNKQHIAAQAKAMRRLSERLFRRFGRRFVTLWTREHNTKGDGSGRLHLNLLWDQDWVDQAWLSETAAACGFGAVVHISRVGAHARGAQRADRYATKCLRYASKDLAGQADWPRGTRRWGASRAARVQMKRPDKNPDWYWSPVEPPTLPLPEAQLTIRLAERPPYESAPGCICRSTFCRCGARADFLAGTNPFARAAPKPPAA
ncbi:MAG: hypothetical protein ACREQR_02720 [Candidatus Binataceae bacterium]